MAEGGGTVGYLSRVNPNEVSVHYVIEYSGRIVQMLREDHLSGSIRPTDLRTTDDPTFTSPDGALVTYGVTAAKAALGKWWYDPNTVVLSVEVEGFAASGPNAAQADALARLVTDVRARYPSIHLLGHADFTSRKACPGKLIQWARLGRGSEDEMRYEAKFERWALDGGPGHVTTFGTPIGPDGKPQYTLWRLALLSGTGDTNKRLELIARNRLTEWDASRDPDFYRALATYSLPEADCKPLEDAVAAKNAALRVIASEATQAAQS